MLDEAIPVEMEAKLLVTRAADLRAIARLAQIGPYPLRGRAAVRLHSTYLDTENLTLARHGVALRLRRQGRHWEATVKWGGRVDGDVHERPELTVALPRPPEMPFVPPPGPLQVQLAALLAGRPLVPILVTEIHRRLFDVLPPVSTSALALPAVPPADPPAPIAELALDRVRLRAPGDGQPESLYFEIEVECRRGKRRDIIRLARQLRRDFDLEPSTRTKLARGLEFLYGPRISGDGGEPRVRAFDTVRDGARHIVARHLQRLRRIDPATRAGADVEALHEMRVTTRRLRAAVHIFAAGFPARLQSRMKRELKWLGQILGGVRDPDVQLARLNDFAAAAPAGFRPEFGCLRDFLEAERGRRRTDLLAGLDSARYFRLLLQLEGFAQGGTRPRLGDAGAQARLATAGCRAVKKVFRRLIDAGEKADAVPRPEDLHALRIGAKRLRYLLEFLEDLTGKAGRRLVQRLTVLQDLLGTYHDAVVAAEFVRSYVESAGRRLTPGQLVALAAIIASELRRAEQERAEFEKTWRRFARRRTAADCRAVLGRLRKAANRREADATPVAEPAAEPVTAPAAAMAAAPPSSEGEAA